MPAPSFCPTCGKRLLVSTGPGGARYVGGHTCQPEPKQDTGQAPQPGTAREDMHYG